MKEPIDIRLALEKIILLKLRIVKPGVKTVFCHQLTVISLLDNVSVFNHKNIVCVLHG